MNKVDVKNIIEKQIDNFIYAGKVAIELRNKGLIKEIKSDNTPVSNGDLEVNRIITKKLLELTPDLPIVSEETSHNKSNKNLTDFWLVDPIDGTKSFLNGKDDFCISIALIKSGRPISAVILNPINKELFEAEKNKGSWLNLKKIYTSKTSKLENSKMCAFKPMFSHPAWKSPWPKMLIENKNSIAYRMALVSNGKFDSMMALNTKSDWDVAAGDLIINEAGGKVTDHKGNQLLYNLENTSKKSIIGTCMSLHDKILELSLIHI